MRDRKDDPNIQILLLISIILSIAVITGAAYYYSRPLRTPSDSTAVSPSGILVPQNENPGLYFDVKGFLRDGKFYIFLPCSAETKELTFYSTDESGQPLRRFTHDFEGGSFDMDGTEVSALRSSLPSVNIRIASSQPSLNEIEDSEDHSLSTRGTLELYESDGSVMREAVTLRGRGNTSWTAEKKSYQAELEKPKDLLSMGRAEKWILLANASDHSLLRNEIFLSLAREIGIKYTPELRQADLFIDGEYRGLYSLCTRVEKGKERVDIEDNDYLYRIGMDKDPYSFFLYDDLSKKGSEEYSKIYGEVRDCRNLEVIDRAAPYLKTVVEELYDPGSDLSGIDLDSLCRYYWLQEFSKTTDPTLRSVYLYRKSDEDMMFFGPAWDYDRTAGIIEMPFREEDYLWPNGWTAREQDYYKSLFKNPVFLEAVNRTYRECGFAGIFANISAELPERIEHIKDSAEMNFIRWDVLNKEENNKIAEVYGDTSYESHLTWLSEWLRMRAEWIEEELSNELTDPSVQVNQTSGNTASSDSR
ncbi:MAG: CotH kinase family protein [Lachnospiraceae bacterium]|nr:CotH kinase family protein [Lachnospiraceae bacterium]